MEQQRQIRKAQEEIYEEEFRRRKLEESIKRTDEMDKRKREKEKKAKADEKEGLKKQKNEEKDAKKRQARFDKYKEKVKKLVKVNCIICLLLFFIHTVGQETKLCQLNDLAKLLGLSKEEVVDILQQLCAQDMEFELCLWSGTDTFLFITRDDYNDFSQNLKGKGKISVEDGYI